MLPDDFYFDECRFNMNPILLQSEMVVYQLYQLTETNFMLHHIY
jgi:hypothetical protein